MIKAVNILLRAFLATTERNGLANVRSLRSLYKGEMIEHVLLENYANVAPDAPKKIEVKVMSSMNVWDLKKLASVLTGVPARLIELKRGEDVYPKLTDLTHAKTLAEMKITKHELITVRKRAKDPSPRAPLVDDSGELTADARNAFLRIFNAVCSPDGLMYPRDSVKFLKLVQGNPNDYITEDNPTLRDFFAKYDPLGQGFITQGSFLEFYSLRSRVAPEVVWRNLSHARIGNDLKPVDTASLSDPHEVVSPDELPRFFMSQDPETQQSLVNLLKRLPSSAQDEMWNIFQLLSPNLDHLRGLLLGDSVAYLQAKSAVPSEFLYCLQLCDNLILFDPSVAQVQTTCYFKHPDQPHYSSANVGYDYQKVDVKKKFEEAIKGLL